MLSEFFVSPARIRAIRGGPSAPRIEAFANHLYQSGYAKISARRHIRSAEHVVHWAIRRDLSVDELDDYALKRFEAHLPRCRCGRFARCGANRMETLSGVRLFVEFLRGSESAIISLTRPFDPEPELLNAFCRWMREQRGTTDSTLDNYRRPIRELIQRFGEIPSKLDARDVNAGRSQSPSSTAHGITVVETCVRAKDASGKWGRKVDSQRLERNRDGSQSIVSVGND